MSNRDAEASRDIAVRTAAASPRACASPSLVNHGTPLSASTCIQRSRLIAPQLGAVDGLELHSRYANA